MELEILKKIKAEQLEQSLNAVSEVTRTFSATELLMREVEEIPTLLAPIFPKVGIIGIAGPSDSGKSAFCRHFAVSVALRQSEFCGFKTNTTHGKAIYVSSEDDENSISFLLHRLNNEYKLSADRYSGLKFITETDNLIERLRTELTSEPVDLIVLDTFGDLYGRSMNESNQVRSFLNDYSQLAQEYKCLIIVLHHTGKRTEEFAPSKHNLLGSQGFESKMRFVAEIRIDRNITNRKHFCIVKGNYLPREYKESSFALEMNENFHYSFTGERVPFQDLAGTDTTQDKEIADSVIKLSNSGMKQTEVAIQLGISQSKVSRILKNNQ